MAFDDVSRVPQVSNEDFNMKLARDRWANSTLRGAPPSVGRVMSKAEAIKGRYGSAYDRP